MNKRQRQFLDFSKILPHRKLEILVTLYVYVFFLFYIFFFPKSFEWFVFVDIFFISQISFVLFFLSFSWFLSELFCQSTSCSLACLYSFFPSIYHPWKIFFISFTSVYLSLQLKFLHFLALHCHFSFTPCHSASQGFFLLLIRVPHWIVWFASEYFFYFLAEWLLS